MKKNMLIIREELIQKFWLNNNYDFDFLFL